MGEDGLLPRLFPRLAVVSCVASAEVAAIGERLDEAGMAARTTVSAAVRGGLEAVSDAIVTPPMAPSRFRLAMGATVGMSNRLVAPNERAGGRRSGR